MKDLKGLTSQIFEESSTYTDTYFLVIDMSLAMASQEKPRVKRKRDGGDEKSDADGRHVGDLVEDVQHDNLAGRVVQPAEGDGRTNAGSGRQAKKLKKKPTVPVVADELQAHDGRAEGEVHAGGVIGEEDDEGESAHRVALSRRRSMHEVARGPLSPRHHGQLWV